MPSQQKAHTRQTPKKVSPLSFYSTYSLKVFSKYIIYATFFVQGPKKYADFL